MFSIRETGLANLHIITSQSDLQYNDVKDTLILRKIFKYCDMNKFYDYIIMMAFSFGLLIAMMTGIINRKMGFGLVVAYAVYLVSSFVFN